MAAKFDCVCILPRAVADLAVFVRFEYPKFFDLPPFFTIQPVLETQKKQCALWGEFILNYCECASGSVKCG